MVTRVSVLIPVFNGAETVSKAIDSILNQSLAAGEIVVCNDGSTDSTHEVCLGYGNLIRYIRLHKNVGLANVRNYLIKNSNYEYVAWQDADDISHPDRLKIQADFLDRHPDFVAVGAHLNIIRDNTFSHVRKYPIKFHDIKKNFLIYSTVAQPALMLKKNVFNFVGYYDVQFPPAEDYDMTERIIRNYKVANIDYPLVDYHLHGDNQTFKNYKKMIFNSYLVKARFISNLKVKFPHKFAFHLIIGLGFLFALMVPRKFFINVFNKFRTC